MSNSFAFDLLVQKKIFKKVPLFSPFLGVGPFVTLGTLKSPSPKNAPYQFKKHSGQWFMRFSKLFAIYNCTCI